METRIAVEYQSKNKLLNDGPLPWYNIDESRARLSYVRRNVMEHIGLKIKSLRKKRDLTQEKLAEYLGVSFQAVSKWETGVAAPDLSMILPLARLLGCSTDELFGLVDSSVDRRKNEIRTLYMQTQHTGDLQARYDIASTAVKEYPGDFEFLYWLGDTEWMYAVDFCEKNSSERKIHLEKSVECLVRVIEDCNNADIKNHAIHSVVLPLVWCDRREEAVSYARQHPDPGFLLLNCLTGEEWTIHRQKLIDEKLFQLLMTLEWGRGSLKCLKAAEEIIKIIIDDGNYLFYHDKLMHIYIGQAICLSRDGKYEETIAALKNSHFHAIQYEKVKADLQDSPALYTCEILNKLSYNDKDIWRTGMTTLMDDFKEYLALPEFDVLRDRPDFTELFSL